jgi:hypothetical protein
MDVFIPRQLNLPGTLTMVNYSLVFLFVKKYIKNYTAATELLKET